MIRLLLILFFIIPPDSGFRTDQKKFSRVKSAYERCFTSVEKLFKDGGLIINESEVLLKVHKMEREIQLWAKHRNAVAYKLIKTYDVCSLSGVPGPKRKRGDLQTPEGYYYIDRFNPSSSYHLSLGINYPNSCDRFNSGPDDPGGDIFIHGKCVTIGCLPITDEMIKEMYVIAVEVKNAGQKKIPVAIFPCDMASERFTKLYHDPAFSSHKAFWMNLKEGFDYFGKHKSLPEIRELAGGYKLN